MVMDRNEIGRTASPAKVFPIDVTAVSQGELLEDLEDRLERSEGFCLATLNLDHIVKLRAHEYFQTAYRRHTHVTADGKPIVWLSRLAGRHIELITGSDLIDPLSAVAARLSVPVALFGSTQETLEQAGDVLCERHPGLQVVARMSPEMGFDPFGPEADDYIEAIRQSGARLCLVALGAPKQELFASRAARLLPETGFVSIGAGLDFLAGAQIRAPRVMRALGGEWLWRMMSDPRRLAPRYAACFAVLPSLFVDALRVRLTEREGRK